MLSFSARLPIYRSRKLNPEMMQAVEELHRSSQTGRLDFESLLSTFMDVLNFDEEYWKALADRPREAMLSRSPPPRPAIARGQDGLIGTLNRYRSVSLADPPQ
jgi:hypothetical protein